MSTDPRLQRGLPERWLLPPAPRDPQHRAEWDALSFSERQRLARVRPGGATALTANERTLVAGLAEARLATGWRLHLGAPVLGWLLLMTLSGFGRSTFPEAAESWFLAGVVAGAALWVGASLLAHRRLGRARALRRELDDVAGPADRERPAADRREPPVADGHGEVVRDLTTPSAAQEDRDGGADDLH